MVRERGYSQVVGRLLLIAAAFAGCTVLALPIAPWVLSLYSQPLPEHTTYILADRSASLVVYLRSAFLAGAGLALALVVYQLTVSKGWASTPSRDLGQLGLLSLIALTYYAGLAFALTVVLPPLVVSLYGAAPLPAVRIDEYARLATSLMLLSGGLFALPPTVISLARRSSATRRL